MMKHPLATLGRLSRRLSPRSSSAAAVGPSLYAPLRWCTSSQKAGLGPLPEEAQKIAPLSSVPSASSLADEMKSKGFVNPTPNFSGSLFDDPSASTDEVPGVPTDLVTVNAESVDFMRDLYGPWLVMTEDLQGELYLDRDRFVFYRPANGLGYGVGKIEVLDAKKAGTAFTMKLETYTYQPTAAFAPRSGVTLEVTGMVKKVSSATQKYQTFSLIGIFRKDDPNRLFADGESVASPSSEQRSHSDGRAGDDVREADALITGQFNAAKLSPWAPTEKDRPWEPNEELQRVFQEVFPQKLALTSHLDRRQARMQAEMPRTSTGGKPHDTSFFHLDLEPYRIGGIPNMYYIPDYINAEEEAQIVALVKNTPAELKSKITKRTVQEWGCTMCTDCEKSFVSDANMPPWVQQCTDMLTYDGIFSPSTFPNSVRIHEYESGEGIGPHCDGPIYVPCVTVLSLASTSVMNFYPRQEPYLDQPMEHYNDTFKFSDGKIGTQVPLFSAVMEPRSLLVFADTAYYYYPHGVSDKAVDDLAPGVAGEVVNRHLLRDKDVTSVERKYRVSITTRNLLTRCNHQPARAEYNMKRAWYVYNQLPVPEPLFAALPELSSSASASSSMMNSLTDDELKASSRTSSGLSPAALTAWEHKMDRIFAEQAEIKRSLQEIKELLTLSVTAEAQFRNDTSTILNNLTTTILDVDAKVEDIRDDVERLHEKS